MPFSLVAGYQHFEWTSFFHLAAATLLPWRWWYPHTKICSRTSQKTIFLIFTATRNSFSFLDIWWYGFIVF